MIRWMQPAPAPKKAAPKEAAPADKTKNAVKADANTNDAAKADAPKTSTAKKAEPKQKEAKKAEPKQKEVKKAEPKKKAVSAPAVKKGKKGDVATPSSLMLTKPETIVVSVTLKSSPWHVVAFGIGISRMAWF